MDILIDFVTGFLNERNEDDTFDRLNYQITPLLFVLLSLINISKLYIGTAINCFTKAEFKGGWIQYAQDYCLVENTYYLRTNESIPVELETRGQKYISYYQWVPFILILQACSFYIPNLLWRSFNWITGFQIRAIVTTAKSNTSMDDTENRENRIKIARSLFHANSLKHRTLHLLAPQRFVAALYLTMKCTYLLLIVVHLMIFKHFLGSLDFAFGVINYKGEWEKSGIFPRVTVCDFSVLRLGQSQKYTLECVLPLNMFNEKIFVFFFFWLCLLFAITIASALLWVHRINDRNDYFRKLLDISSQNELTIKLKKIHMKDASFNNNTIMTQPLTKPIDFNVFGPDFRVVLGLIQDQTGLIYCSNLFMEVCRLNEQRVNSEENIYDE